MVPMENLLPFVVASAVLIVVPGPSVLFTIGRTLALGRAGGLLSVLGNALGTVPLVLAVAFGVGAIVAQSVAVFTVLKLAGALYLVYLGVQAIRHRQDAATPASPNAVPRPARRLLAQGFVVGITNPKSVVFFVAVLPQFVDLRAGSVPLQMLTLGLVFLLIGLTCDSVWSLASSVARDWLARSPRRMAAMSATGGGLMIGLGGILAFTGNKRV